MSTRTWRELIDFLLSHGKTTEEIAVVLRELVEKGEMSEAEAAARVEQAKRQFTQRAKA
jgi:polyhydroxyalkanoate synthesis regulator phasin